MGLIVPIRLMNNKKFIPPRGNYQALLSCQKAVCVSG